MSSTRVFPTCSRPSHGRGALRFAVELVAVADPLSKAHRSRLMARVRTKDTAPEVALQTGALRRRCARLALPSRASPAGPTSRSSDVGSPCSSTARSGTATRTTTGASRARSGTRRSRETARATSGSTPSSRRAAGRVVRIWDFEVERDLAGCVARVTRRFRQPGIPEPPVGHSAARPFSLRSVAPYTLIDLFAGCGGMTRGFVDRALRAVFAVELDRDAAATYRRNFGDHIFR